MAKERGQCSPGDVVLPGARKREPIVGRRSIRMLEDQLACLHAQPMRGNRKSFADHILAAHLIVFFNPAIASLRTIEDVFEHDGIRRRMRLPRVPKSTLSDARRVFDLAPLQPLVDDLVRRLGRLPHDSRLDVVTREIVAVDASAFEVAARIAWALPRSTNRAWRGAMVSALRRAAGRSRRVRPHWRTRERTNPIAPIVGAESPVPAGSRLPVLRPPRAISR